MVRQLEGILHQQVVDYLHVQYPDVLYRTDFASGIKMTMGQAVKHKRLQKVRAWPDLQVLRAWPGGNNKHNYLGLFIELKHPEGGHMPFLKDGITRSKNKHCMEQWAILDWLTAEGYCACMAVGFDQAKLIIDWYLVQDLKKPQPTPHAFANAKEFEPYEYFL